MIRHRWFLAPGALVFTLACSAPDANYRDGWCARFCANEPRHADCATECPESGSSGDDGGLLDGGARDAGEADAGLEDAGLFDAGEADAGTPDAGSTDAGVPDAGSADGGTGDAGNSDAGTGDAGPPDAGAPVLFVRAPDGSQLRAAGECEALEVGFDGLSTTAAISLTIENTEGLGLYRDLNCYTPLLANVYARQGQPARLYFRSPRVGVSKFKVIPEVGYPGGLVGLTFTGRLNVSRVPETLCPGFVVRLTSPRNPKTPVSAPSDLLLDAGVTTWFSGTNCASSYPSVGLPQDGGVVRFAVHTPALFTLSAETAGAWVAPAFLGPVSPGQTNTTCDAGADCTSGSCSAGVCACVESGGQCFNTNDCCVDVCTTGKTCP